MSLLNCLQNKQTAQQCVDTLHKRVAKADCACGKCTMCSGKRRRNLYVETDLVMDYFLVYKGLFHGGMNRNRRWLVFNSPHRLTIDQLKQLNGSRAIQMEKSKLENYVEDLKLIRKQSTNKAFPFVHGDNVVVVNVSTAPQYLSKMLNTLAEPLCPAVVPIYDPVLNRCVAVTVTDADKQAAPKYEASSFILDPSGQTILFAKSAKGDMVVPDQPVPLATVGKKIPHNLALVRVTENELKEWKAIIESQVESKKATPTTVSQFHYWATQSVNAAVLASQKAAADKKNGVPSPPATLFLTPPATGDVPEDQVWAVYRNEVDKTIPIVFTRDGRMIVLRDPIKEEDLKQAAIDVKDGMFLKHKNIKASYLQKLVERVVSRSSGSKLETEMLIGNQQVFIRPKQWAVDNLKAAVKNPEFLNNEDKCEFGEKKDGTCERVCMPGVYWNGSRCVNYDEFLVHQAKQAKEDSKSEQNDAKQKESDELAKKAREEAERLQKEQENAANEAQRNEAKRQGDIQKRISLLATANKNLLDVNSKWVKLQSEFENSKNITESLAIYNTMVAIKTSSADTFLNIYDAEKAELSKLGPIDDSDKKSLNSFEENAKLVRNYATILKNAENAVSQIKAKGAALIEAKNKEFTDSVDDLQKSVEAVTKMMSGENVDWKAIFAKVSADVASVKAKLGVSQAFLAEAKGLSEQYDKVRIVPEKFESQLSELVTAVDKLEVALKVGQGQSGNLDAMFTCPEKLELFERNVIERVWTNAQGLIEMGVNECGAFIVPKDPIKVDADDLTFLQVMSMNDAANATVAKAKLYASTGLGKGTDLEPWFASVNAFKGELENGILSGKKRKAAERGPDFVPVCELQDVQVATLANGEIQAIVSSCGGNITYIVPQSGISLTDEQKTHLTVNVVENEFTEVVNNGRALSLGEGSGTQTNPYYISNKATQQLLDAAVEQKKSRQ